MVESTEIIAVLKAALSVEVYADFVPEGAGLPAVALTHVANTEGRVLSGKKAGKTAVWRVTISAPSDTEAKAIASELEVIDNTPQQGFSSIRVEFIQFAPKGINEQYRRIFYDIFARK
tara:strand:- start:577 stop:930 length:354 start_codon:yes stop_codon:yes gene_type:complete